METALGKRPIHDGPWYETNDWTGTRSATPKRSAPRVLLNILSFSVNTIESDFIFYFPCHSYKPPQFHGFEEGPERYEITITPGIPHNRS